MTAGLERRLIRLEGSTPNTIQAMSDDDLQARLLELTQRAAVTPDLDPSLRQRLADAGAALVAGVHRQAQLIRDGAYARHSAGYEPPVFGGISSDPDFQAHMPSTAIRRRALRARPDIAALIAEGLAA